MRIYEVKRGHGKCLLGDGLPDVIAETVGQVERVQEWYISHHAALTRLAVRLVSKSEIEVDTTLDGGASLEEATAAHEAFNSFLAAATGFTAKQRADRAKRKAKAEAKAQAEADAQAET